MDQHGEKALRHTLVSFSGYDILLMDVVRLHKVECETANRPENIVNFTYPSEAVASHQVTVIALNLAFGLNKQTIMCASVCCAINAVCEM